jgi:thiol-disulfide isomerase/thioredoxin
MMRRLTTIALAITIFCVAVAQAQTSRRGGASPSRAKTSSGAKTSTPNAAPVANAPLVTEVDLEGLKKLLQPGADAAKARPLLVNFWATWCDPCREEFPDLVRVNNDYKDRGLQFVVVSGDDISEIKTGVPKFLAEMKATMPAYLLNVPDMEIAINTVDATWGGEMPATFLYDRAGQVVFKHFGRVDPKELRAALDKVLAAN